MPKTPFSNNIDYYTPTPFYLCTCKTRTCNRMIRSQTPYHLANVLACILPRLLPPPCSFFLFFSKKKKKKKEQAVPPRVLRSRTLKERSFFFCYAKQTKKAREKKRKAFPLWGGTGPGPVTKSKAAQLQWVPPDFSVLPGLTQPSLGVPPSACPGLAFFFIFF